MAHLEGMGILGCLIALELERAGLDFTWEDNDARVTAWKAATGAIFPDGDAVAAIGLRRWEQLIREEEYGAHMEVGRWCYTQKHAPHGAKLEVERSNGPLKVAYRRSLHLNAQTFVRATRERFEYQREPVGSRPPGIRIVAHGFGPFMRDVVWGWTRLVRLNLPHWLEGEPRPAIYCREGRYVMAYAYPQPGGPWWYAGSSLIPQRVPHKLELAKKYERWREQIIRLTDGQVGVLEEGGYMTGWRPRGSERVVPIRQGETIYVPSLWHNGIRIGPIVAEMVRKLMYA